MYPNRIKRYSHSTPTKDYPSPKVKRPLKSEQIEKRPLRFQLRSIVHPDLLGKDPWWMVVHRAGPSRPQLGGDPLEARAVPHDVVAGTLPERIIYKYLAERLRMVPEVDFIFQTSLEGGRVELGGIVADFTLPMKHIAIQVQGPTHSEYYRMAKDREQRMALYEMGYEVYEIWEYTIYNEQMLDEWMQATFGWVHSGGGSPSEFGTVVSMTEWDDVMNSLNILQNML